MYRAAVSSVLLLALGGVALAQPRHPPPPLHAAQPTVEGLVVERVARLAPGVTLHFSVFGSIRAEVGVAIEGVARRVVLREVQPGVYEGSHVIAAGDALRSDSRVVATMKRDGEVAYASLDEPLVLAALPVPWASARVTTPVPSPQPAPGMPRVLGSHGTDLASIVPPPAQAETRAQTQPQALPPPWLPTRSAVIDPAPRLAAARAAACGDCLRVESIQEVEAASRDGLAGVVTRAVTDHRRRMLGLLGAIGIPGAARESERLAERAVAYEVVLRRADGVSIVRRYPALPSLRIGDVVPPPDDPAVIAAGS